jgi:hypothetical protein
MKHNEFNLDDAVALLERTPASLSALLVGLPEKWVTATEGDGTWSPYDVIGHLIHGERTDWIPRARHILAGETRPFEALTERPSLPRARARAWKNCWRSLAIFGERVWLRC